MVSSTPPPTEKHEEFSLPLFALTVVVTLAGLLAILRFAAPAVWDAQLLAPWWKFAVAFAAVSLLNCFFEFFFHRYVLHLPALPGLQRLYRQHTLHHALTRIARKPTKDGRGVLFVENKFPIVEARQGEGSFFPWYSLAIFSLFLSPAFMLGHLIWPAFPWFFGGLAALASSITLYEVLHAINHWPFEKWAPLIEHPTWGFFWRPVYSFHLRHHAVIDCNESVSGFFGLPVADWVFGTCLIPSTIYADGEEWKPENFVAPRPRGLIRWLDARAGHLVESRRAGRANQSRAEVPHRVYSRGEEIANWLTHGVGAVMSVVALTLLIIFASTRGNAWHLVSFTVFGLSLFVLYTASTLYHLSRNEGRRRLLRRIDQAAIFVLIAGTYTPFLLTNLRGPWGWTLLGIIWTLCGAGAVLKFFGAGRDRTASIIAYLFAGWLIVAAAKPLLATVPQPGLWLLLAGGVCYSVGVLFYVWRQLRFHHAFWHSFVLGGSTCHFLAVLLFLTPHQG
ncbi:MAG: PAQR family membrane homeostasis protein TrhA [Opitutaceae bacterium]